MSVGLCEKSVSWWHERIEPAFNLLRWHLNPELTNVVWEYADAPTIQKVEALYREFSETELKTLFHLLQIDGQDPIELYFRQERCFDLHPLLLLTGEDKDRYQTEGSPLLAPIGTSVCRFEVFKQKPALAFHLESPAGTHHCFNLFRLVEINPFIPDYCFQLSQLTYGLLEGNPVLHQTQYPVAFSFLRIIQHLGRLVPSPPPPPPEHEFLDSDED